VRPLGEARAVVRRLAAPGLTVAAAVAALGGAGGVASLLLLAAIVAESARLLETVGAWAEGRSDRFPVVMSVAGLVFLVAAGASHVTTLGVGLLVCLGLELLGEAGVRPDLGSDATDVVEGPMSPAA